MIHADKLKRLRDKLQGLKWVPLREMTKIPFCLILCKNDGIKCREICNGLRDPFKWLVMQEKNFGWF